MRGSRPIEVAVSFSPAMVKRSESQAKRHVVVGSLEDKLRIARMFFRVGSRKKGLREVTQAPARMGIECRPALPPPLLYPHVSLRSDNPN